MNVHEMVAMWDRRRAKAVTKTATKPVCHNFGEYQKNSPSGVRLDQLEKLVASGKISTVRQAGPCVYVYVVGKSSVIVEPPASKK